MSGIKGINAGKANGNYKHGQTKTHLFRVWSHMRERCEREGHPYFKYYGGRGILVCSEWKDFLVFKAWAEKSGYQRGLTIDRIDTNGGYEPSNCRWATQKEQQNNKRSNHKVEYNGETRNLSEWADMLGIGRTTLRERLKHGWSVEKALFAPVRQRGAQMKEATK